MESKQPGQVFTAHARTVFLDFLRHTPNVTLAAKQIGISRRRVYQLRAKDPELAADWDDAIGEAVDALEAEARRRAVEGWIEPVYYRGEKIDEVRRYSDRLLEVLLQAHRPELFRRRHELTGPNGSPLPGTRVIQIPNDGDRLDEVARILRETGSFDGSDAPSERESGDPDGAQVPE